MPRKNPTKEQLDEFEAVADEFIKRGHIQSLDPKDDKESFAKKFKRSIDKKRRPIEKGQREEEEDTILFEFESGELEREFEKKLRKIFPDPEVSEKKHEEKDEIGSSWTCYMHGMKTVDGAITKYDITARTWAEGLMPNRLVAQVNLLDRHTFQQLLVWKSKVEPGTYVEQRCTLWGNGALFGTRHVIYYNNWTGNLCRRFYVSQESPWTIDGWTEF